MYYLLGLFFCLNCTTFLNAQDCLGALFIEPFETCNADGTFNIDISFENISCGNDSFNLWVNGVNADNYSSYPETFITVPNLVMETGQEINVQIIDSQNPSCASGFTFTAPDCTAITCDIFDATFQTTPCDGRTINGSLDFERLMLH